jgi:glutamate-ammonia-ligase adenylyltransferase
MKRSRKSIRQAMLALIAEIVGQHDHPGLSARLGEMGFPTTGNAAELLKSITTRLGGEALANERLAIVLLDMLESPYPDGALLNFLRYIDTSGTPSVFLSTVAGGKPVREILATVFGASQYMSDIIIRNPGYLYWLIEKQTWERRETKDSYLAELMADAANFQTIDGKLNAARRLQRRALLKIGVQDLLGLHAVEETALALSHLAEAIAEGVLGMLWDSLPALKAVGPATGFAVLALGKLGGEELNYSSDIDLIYICKDAEDETIASYHELARKFTTAISEVTAEGYLYRVDLRLRPDGDVGPLVSPLAALMVYYENRGRPWEFQAMLKARVIAGDHSLGKRFLEDVSALAFSPTLSYSPVDAIAVMRRRIQESISTRDRTFNIKLMEGGIRDIEFIVQMLQLLHGSNQPDLRVSFSTRSSTGLFSKPTGSFGWWNTACK